MKKYDRICAGIIIGYLCMSLLLFVFQEKGEVQQGRPYLVEVHEIMAEVQGELASGVKPAAGNGQAGKTLVRQCVEKAIAHMDMSGMVCVRQVEFLAAWCAADAAAAGEFYRNENGVESHIEPLTADGELLGYLRFDYVDVKEHSPERLTLAVFLLLPGGILAVVLLFIRFQILKPFHTISELPYELAKGHLGAEIEESKNRYFGRFSWGISMLRDELLKAKARELALEKEKKLMLLSISHDIRTPLNAIKLYAKALEEELYSSKEERRQAACSIETHAKEIEMFVGEIVKSQSEDILSLEVRNSEFYVRDLLEKLRGDYEPKCRLKLISFEIGSYENKLLAGDFDRSYEVLENLMENAFKYGDGKSIVISVAEEEYCLLISVTNTGIPVKEQEMAHLFDSFFRGSNAEGVQGNGLGLYICRQLMRKMGGDVYAKCRDGGMEFILVFHE